MQLLLCKKSAMFGFQAFHKGLKNAAMIFFILLSFVFVLQVAEMVKPDGMDVEINIVFNTVENVYQVSLLCASS